VFAAFPGGTAPAVVGSCIGGPTALLAGFVTDSSGGAGLSFSGGALAPFLRPGTTFLLEARGPRNTSAGGALGVPVRTQALELHVRP
jgi:hypothetical protein